MKVYIVDNYDSFTYNLYQFIGEILEAEQQQGRIDSFEILVKRNDDVVLEQIAAARPDAIIISPGPGSPEDPAYFGVCADTIRELGKTIPTLGVCLGMQGIVHVFGGKIIKAKLPMHGKISAIRHRSQGVFSTIPDKLEVMRYHSLIADSRSIPDCLEITAIIEPDDNAEFIQLQPENLDESLEIMGVRHREYPIEGIQFHPESFATEAGKEIIRNFLFRD